MIDLDQFDDYPMFLARRRYDRALIWPWLLMALAGSVLVVVFLHAIFTSPFVPTAKQFLNRYMGGLVVSTIVAIVGLAMKSSNRWLGLVIMVGLLPLVGLFFEVLGDPRPVIRSTGDAFGVIALPTMFLTAGYVLLRPTPRPPRRVNA